ncbi:MAG TPA: HMG-box domain-containing protein [Candidatus Paceibacterota bacterium]|nr:HMG-box domain-containing protein [Candidatus Paceibacterota bacterium]
MRTLSLAWNNLTEEQRQAWNDAARKDRRGGVAARSRRRSGQRLFVKVNSWRLALGQERLTWPPGPGSFKPIPMARFEIANSGGRMALRLHLAGGMAEGVMVSS